MTGSKGNSKFCFLANCNFHQGDVNQNILVKGKQNLLFPVKAVILSVLLQLQFLFLRKVNCLMLTSAQICCIFKEHGLDHKQVEISSWFFWGELLTFVCPKELVSFYQQRVACFLPIRKCIWVGRNSVQQGILFCQCYTTCTYWNCFPPHVQLLYESTSELLVMVPKQHRST